MTPILWRITAALALVCALIAAVLIYGQKQYRAGHTPVLRPQQAPEFP